MRRTLVLIAAALTAASLSARATDYPDKPIHVLIPFGAGSATDIIPRIAFDQLSKELGQQIIVENRGGAGGTIGEAQVAKAVPDGYTLLAASSAHTSAPALYSKLTYNAAKDFTAIGIIGTAPIVLVVSPSKGIKTLRDFVAKAKAKPGSFTFATLGVGSAVYMSAERFRLSAGFKAVNVPFKGGAEAMTEVMAGRVDYYFAPVATALPFIKSGKLQALAVSERARVAALPNVPTTLESGFPNSDYTVWIGMFAPAKTPKAIVDKLNAALIKSVTTPSVKAKFDALGVQTVAVTPAQFEAQVNAEFGTYAAFAKAIGAKVN